MSNNSTIRKHTQPVILLDSVWADPAEGPTEAFQHSTLITFLSKAQQYQLESAVSSLSLSAFNAGQHSEKGG